MLSKQQQDSGGQAETGGAGVGTDTTALELEAKFSLSWHL